MAVSDRRHDDYLAFQQLDAFVGGEDSGSRSPSTAERSEGCLPALDVAHGRKYAGNGAYPPYGSPSGPRRREFLTTGVSGVNLMLTGCEFAGKTTLGEGICAWIAGTMGQQPFLPACAAVRRMFANIARGGRTTR